MILSRKWLNEFVDVSDISDREFDEAMTLSGSKVETVTALDESLKNAVRQENPCSLFLLYGDHRESGNRYRKRDWR